jgi:hypothetical protein
MTGTEAAERAKQELSKLTGLRADTVSALSHEKDGWHVTVDLIELKRIPDSSDVLDSYETLLDDEGNLLTYKRTQRNSRAGDLLGVS